MPQDRGRLTRNAIGLILYLCGGWRSFREITQEFDWKLSDNHYKTAGRNVQALEEAGLPIEWDESEVPMRVHLPQDWVARTPWLRRYIIRQEPLKVANRKFEQARRKS